MATTFESVTCSRCGGSGKYSYCSMYGDTCFKCRGRKNVYTKRGYAAKLFYERQLSKLASEIVVGESIYIEPGPLNRGGFSKVTEISPDTTLYNGHVREGALLIVTPLMSQGVSGDTIIRVAATAEQKQVAVAKALEYQASLTKQGTERKRKSS